MKSLRCLLLVSSMLLVGHTAQAEVPPDFVLKWGSGGTGDGQFQKPRGVAVDGSGNVYVVDSANHRIQKFDGNGTFLTKWGRPGSGDGEFNFPNGVAVDGSGNVYVADTDNHRIQKFDGNGTFLTKWMGPRGGEFNRPFGVAVDGTGNVYVSDQFNFQIQKFDGNGVFLTRWGSMGSGDGQFNGPRGIATDAAGNVYVCDSGNHRVEKFDATGTFLTKWGSFGPGDGEFKEPSFVATDAAGNVYVTDGRFSVQEFDGAGALLTKWGSFGPGDGEFPGNTQGIAVDASGSIYVADGERVQKFSRNTVTTPQQQVAAIGDAVQALVTGGALAPNQAGTLQSKLNAAVGLLDQGNTQGAIGKLGDFIKQVSSYIKTGKLTAAQGQALIDAAEALIADLQAANPNGHVLPVAAGPGREDVAESAALLPFRVTSGTCDASRGTITLRFDLPRSNDVTLELYDIAGRRIDAMSLGRMGPGRQEWTSARLNLPSTLLFYRLTAGQLTATGKVPFVK